MKPTFKPGTLKPNSVNDAARWLIRKEITLGKFIHNSGLESCYGQAEDFAGGICNLYVEAMIGLRDDIRAMVARSDKDSTEVFSDKQLQHDIQTAESARRRALGEVLQRLQFRLGQLIEGTVVAP